MPDLTIEMMSMCAQLEPRYYSVGGYRQWVRNEDEAECSCPAFKYHKGPCKHLKEVFKTRCTYFELVDGPPLVEGVCPKCGGKLIPVRVAV